MMRGGLLLVASVWVASCDRADYVIDLKRGHIEQVSRTGGSGYVIVSKASADTMAKYGDVYIEGRSCPDVKCKSFPVGTLRKYDSTAVKDGVRLDIEPLFLAENNQNYPSFWLKNIACIKVEAMQGFMGRTGRSAWNCSVTHRSS